MLAIAASMGPKRQVARSLGTLPTGSVLFAAFLAGTIIIVGALSYLAALALGPMAEHLAMLAGHTTPYAATVPRETDDATRCRVASSRRSRPSRRIKRDRAEGHPGRPVRRLRG
jgi:hypothetical protein